MAVGLPQPADASNASPGRPSICSLSYSCVGVPQMSSAQQPPAALATSA